MGENTFIVYNMDVSCERKLRVLGRRSLDSLALRDLFSLIETKVPMVLYIITLTTECSCCSAVSSVDI